MDPDVSRPSPLSRYHRSLIVVALGAALLWANDGHSQPRPPRVTVKLPARATVRLDMAPQSVADRVLAELRQKLAELDRKLPPGLRSDARALAHQGLLDSLRRAEAYRVALLGLFPGFHAKLEELRWMRKGVFLDPRRCQQSCQLPPAICAPDPTKCTGGEPPACPETCVNGPEVCVDDPSSCVAGEPARCEQICTPGARVCRTELYDCRPPAGCKTRQVDCWQAPQVCVDDPTRCTPATPPVCAKKCTPGPRICGPDLANCTGGTAPSCANKCIQPPAVCTRDCRASNPVDTGYDPSTALAASGRRKLLTKAKKYERLIAGRQYADGLMRRIRVDPSRLVRGYPAVIEVEDSVRNAAAFTGTYLAGVAYKYGVTRKQADLNHLIKVLSGVYYLTTLASAPIPGDDLAVDGRLIHKDSCKHENKGRQPDESCKFLRRTRRGVWLRALYVGWDSETEVRQDARNTSWGEHTWGFEARRPVRGFPRTCPPGTPCPAPRRFHLESEISRDNVDYLLFGLAAAHEVLTANGKHPEWRRRIALVVLDFMHTLIANDWKLTDLDGAPTSWGNESVWPSTNAGNEHGGDPSNMLEVLSWLKIAIQITGDQGLANEYEKKVDQHIRGKSVDSVFRAFDPMLSKFIDQYPELIEMGLWPPRYRPAQLMVVFHGLVRYETDPELRGFYLGYMDEILYPLVARNRVPLFDAIYLAAKNLGDTQVARLDGGTESMRGRIAGVLYQYRDQPPFGIKPPRPASLAGCAVEHAFHTSYAGCSDMVNPLTEAWQRARALSDDFPAINEDAVGVWPLGWGVTPKSDAMWDAGATFALTAEKKNEAPANRNVEPAGYDYLVQYWFARYHGSLAAP